MQSQQKKVKWSRGETADALEERTDTGITQVSVSKMENIIADVYGNISRRPAFKVIDSVVGANQIPVISWISSGSGETDFSESPQYFVFTVDANSYIIFVKNWLGQAFGGFLIQNEKFVKRVKITNNTGYTVSGVTGEVSAAQYNNFMVVSNLYTFDVILRLTPDNDIIVEKFKFSAPWYAPGGTQTKTVSSAILTGLEFNKDGNGFRAFSWTDRSGNSSPYSIIDTGLTGTSVDVIAEEITIGSIVKFPNMGAYMRVEGYIFDSSAVYYIGTIFDGVLYETDPVPSSGIYARTAFRNQTVYLDKYIDGQLQASVDIGVECIVQCRTSLTGFSQYRIGAGFAFEWVDYTGNLKIQMFGPLLTPVASANSKDTSVTVEYGYISLDTYQPKQFTFSNQRLYAGGFYNANGDPKQIPGYAVGSQIAKYNDFKNDYNTQNEAITIDISTHYQEQILSLVDYNGLKILTDSAEYSYSAQNGIVKQSENGSLATCKPLVFGSVCLYADKSGGQIRAMQYEFQNDQFTSSSINLLAQEDLIFNTTAMAGHLDKEHYNGRFLYCIQEGYDRTNVIRPTNPTSRHALAVCNMMPGNQAMIWTRWNDPEIKTEAGYARHTIMGALEVNNKVWFILACQEHSGGYVYPGYTLAELDYESRTDIETELLPSATDYRIIKPVVNSAADTRYAWTKDGDLTVYTASAHAVSGDPVYLSHYSTATPEGTVDSVVGDTLTYTIYGVQKTANYDWSKSWIYRYATMPRATVSVFDGDTYKWDDTLTANGEFTKSLATLENPRVGFLVEALLESHPLDIQGKTYTEKKRIGKALAVIRDTEPGAFTVCDKTGYTSKDKKTVNFYGCTGMKEQVRYTIKNIQGAKFTIESLTMIIEYGTLDS